MGNSFKTSSSTSCLSNLADSASLISPASPASSPNSKYCFCPNASTGKNASPVAYPVTNKLACPNYTLSTPALTAILPLDISTQKKKKSRQGRVLPPPQRSACMYVQIAPKDIAMFKFLLEADDNLGYMSVVDRWSAALKLVYSPHQQKALQAWLQDTAKALQFKEIWLNGKVE